MASKKWLVGIIGILVISCGESSVFISYNLPVPVKTEVFSQSTYATMDGEYEQVGTLTSTRFTNEYSQSEDMLYLERAFISDASKGYLKKSYPSELAFKVPKMKLTAKGMKVLNIEGYENFDSVVVAKISIPDRWRKQISRMTRQIDLDRIEKRRWEVTHLLSGEIPFKSNITDLLKSQGRLPSIPNAQIDSVVTKRHKKNL